MAIAHIRRGDTVVVVAGREKGKRGKVQRLVLGSSLRFVVLGAAIGLVAAVITSRWIASQLFAVSATDPLSYAGVAFLIVVTAVAATWWPARKAAQVDPATTLRAH